MYLILETINYYYYTKMAIFALFLTKMAKNYRRAKMAKRAKMAILMVC